MLELDLHALDPAYSQVVRSRLTDRGHRVHPVTDPESGTSADVRLVVTGQQPLSRMDLAAFLRTVLPRGRAGVPGLLALVATIDPTQETVTALFTAGFDALLGVSAQRDLERHVEALGVAVRRAVARQHGRGHLREPAGTDPAVAYAQCAERLAHERSHRREHGLASLADPALRAEAERLAFERRAVLVRGESGAGRRHFARVLHTVAERPGPFVEVSAERFDLPRVDRDARIAALLDHTRGGTLCVLGHEALARDDRRALAEAAHRARSPRLVFTGAPEANIEAGDAHAPVIVDVPPLRAVPHTLPLLLSRLFDGHVPSETLLCLAAYPWPGNITELASTLARAAKRATKGTLFVEHLPRALRSPQNGAQANDAPSHEVTEAALESWQISPDDPLTHSFYERKRLLRALVVARFNRTEAADLAHMSRSTFYRKLREYGLTTNGNTERGAGDSDVSA